VSALRIASPDGIRFVDLGPQRAVRPPGAPTGRAIQPRSGMTRTDRDAANQYAAKYREKMRAER
jgi:hypothetical protein